MLRGGERLGFSCCFNLWLWMAIVVRTLRRGHGPWQWSAMLGKCDGDEADCWRSSLFWGTAVFGWGEARQKNALEHGGTRFLKLTFEIRTKPLRKDYVEYLLIPTL